MPTRKTIVVPCIVNSSLYCSAVSTRAVRARELQADEQRLDAADQEEDQRGACRTGSPIFLWSTVVNQLHEAGRRARPLRASSRADAACVDECGSVFDSRHVYATPRRTTGDSVEPAVCVSRKLRDLLALASVRHARVLERRHPCCLRGCPSGLRPGAS